MGNYIFVGIGFEPSEQDIRDCIRAGIVPDRISAQVFAYSGAEELTEDMAVQFCSYTLRKPSIGFVGTKIQRNGSNGWDKEFLSTYGRKKMWVIEDTLG
jgi:hypothetical protein